ncbi:MAG TPA: SufE family protein [Pseudomonadales bacterium]
MTELDANRIRLDEIRDAFAFFDSWEDRYRFVIDLGKELANLDDVHKTEQNLVRGCQSQVWLVARYEPAGGVMHLELDSDAHIVRGLIAIVLAAYDGRTPREILDFDIEGLFEELDLLKHLSPTRGNGLRAMVGRIREIAAAHA